MNPAESQLKMFIIAAPSGAGKSSFVQRITKEMPEIEDTVTYTTRTMRAGEREGFPYHFISRDQFEHLIAQDFFVEWALVHDHLYGTSRKQIEEMWERGKAVIMDVDVQGAATFKQKYPHAHSIFIVPPSIDTLRQRVIGRDGKVPSDIEVRMRNAEMEIRRAGEFDHQIVQLSHEDFEHSYQKFKKVVVELLLKR